MNSGVCSVIAFDRPSGSILISPRQRIAFFSLPEGEGGEDRRSEPGGEISPPRLASLGDPPLRGGKSLTYARLPRALRKNSDGGRSSTRSARTSCPAPPGRTP